MNTFMEIFSQLNDENKRRITCLLAVLADPATIVSHGRGTVTLHNATCDADALRTAEETANMF